MDRGRKRALIAIVALCVVGGIAFLVVASRNPSDVSTDASPALAQGVTELAGSKLMVRAVDRSDPRLNGRVFLVDGGHPQEEDGPELLCQRVYFAGGRGLCLATAKSGIEYHATIFDSSFRQLHELSLAGLPSRARVSPNGRYGAMTVFVNGHAYLGGGGFSTATTLVDMHSGKELGNLESFTVTKGGKTIESADFNFWGVTFAQDSNHFYATLRTGSHYYLVEGDIATRTMRVLRDGVECPSLSPDGKRIAFKSRIGAENLWRLKVLDLATLKDHPVAEPRSIDDQVEWLNDDTLIYSDGLDTYTVPADGGGKALLVLRDASSPTTLR